MVCYFAINILPKVHFYYVFNLAERTNPLWTYTYKIAFHALIFYKEPTKPILTILTWTIVILWKELRFLVRHAEKRLGKIDTELYNAEKGIRIAHIRPNTIDEDNKNRFHLNLYHTNRLYMLPFTNETEKDYCAIHNYKIERRDGMIPKLYNEWEKRMWRASDDKSIFVLHRSYYTLFPLLYVFFAIFLTSIDSNAPYVYTNLGLFTIEILTTLLTSVKYNDFIVDVTYYVVSTGFMIMQAQAVCY